MAQEACFLLGQDVRLEEPIPHAVCCERNTELFGTRGRRSSCLLERVEDCSPGPSPERRVSVPLPRAHQASGAVRPQGRGRPAAVARV